MNNLPISTGAPQTAIKPASASANNDDSAKQGQPFGDVLARQVSDASAAEDTPVPNKITAKSADEIYAHIKAKNTDDTTATTAGDNQSNLPADMIASLVPLAAAAQQNISTSQTPNTAQGPSD